MTAPRSRRADELEQAIQRVRRVLAGENRYQVYRDLDSFDERKAAYVRDMEAVLSAVRVPAGDDGPDHNEHLAVALHTLAKSREIGKRHPEHYQNVGLQHKHIVAVLTHLQSLRTQLEEAQFEIDRKDVLIAGFERDEEVLESQLEEARRDSRECGPEDHECPCGNALKRNGETVKSHWHGVICEECEADIFRKAQRRHSPHAMFHAFIPDAPHPSDVEAIDLSAVKPIEREWSLVQLQPGDRYREKSTGIGRKSLYVIEVERAAIDAARSPSPETEG